MGVLGLGNVTLDRILKISMNHEPCKNYRNTWKIKI